MAMDSSEAPAAGGLYAQVWRWHFYAGLLVAPFLIILSVTGGIYLFDDELNDWLQPELRFAASDGPALPPGRLIAAAEATYPGARVTRLDMPTAPGRSVMLHLDMGEGLEPRRAFVDPGSAELLGDIVYSRTLVGFADRMHGSLLLGDVGDAIVEIAACWTVVLVLTGLYLWWPRSGRQAGRWLPEVRARGRRFWRSLHGVTGLYAALLILFLVMSGLPWATVWGGMYLTPISNALGLGYPAANRTRTTVAVPNTATVGEVLGDAPWALLQAPMPASVGGMHAHHHHQGGGGEPAGGVDIGVDAAVQRLAELGMATAFRLTLPHGPTGAYTAYLYPDRPQGQRTLHLDRYSGEVLGDIRFADYGAVAKAVEWGVAVHLGRYFGPANQALMLSACLLIVTLVVTGVVMWWRRRPQGRLGAPVARRRLGWRATLALVALLLLCFPLAGASLLLVMVLEAGGRRWVMMYTRKHVASKGM